MPTQDRAQFIRYTTVIRLSTLFSLLACLLVFAVGSQLWAQVTTTKTSVNFGSVNSPWCK